LAVLDVSNRDYAGAIVRPSPNFGPRKDVSKPQFIILHYTGMETGEAAETLLLSAHSQVSAHYVVREDGTVVQMVSEKKRAWHAGESRWQNITDMNSHSIGIEVVNCGEFKNFPKFPEVQIAALVALCSDIIARYDIAARCVLGHSDIAPERKTDPGQSFPWQTLYQNGIGHWVTPTPIMGGPFMARGDSGMPVEAYQSMLAVYGYNLPLTTVYDAQTEWVTKAFQRHFRPEKIDGVADFSTVDTLHRLLASLRQL